MLLRSKIITPQLLTRQEEGRLVLRSVITCPHCGHRAEEEMPTNACLFFYDCLACHARLKPKAGDCCVFCSYGSVLCPPAGMSQVGCSSPGRSFKTATIDGA
ncbi:MAG TPA: GDCCVxC domain-containing (seleno)protein [Chthoniobacterales bacterium]|nr:GDCCVxC domain-containing (seleno)protein [Chthoniobacterales bacterium]